MVVTLSHAGTSVFTAATAPDRLVVGTVDGAAGLRRSERGWDLEDRSLEGAHVHALTVVGSLIFAGLSPGGLHVSSDLGKTWRATGHDLHDADIYGVTATAGDAPLLYVGTEPAHIYVSDDLGESFHELPGLRDIPDVDRWWFPAPPHEAHTKHIAIDPTDPRVIYACVEQGALLKSEDAGTNWTRCEGTDDDAHRIVIDPGNPRRLFATSGVGAFASVDAGESWDRLTAPGDATGSYPDQLVLCASRPDVLFLTAALDNPGTWSEHIAVSRVSRSVDGGRTWAQLGGGLPDPLEASIEALTLVDIPGQPATLFFATTRGEIWEGRDDGDRWVRAMDQLPPVSKGGHHLQFARATASTAPAG